jgi:hypothetical protein
MPAVAELPEGPPGWGLDEGPTRHQLKNKDYECTIVGKRPVGKPRKRWVNAVEIDSREVLKVRISRQASLEASLQGGQGSTSGSRAIGEEVQEEGGEKGGDGEGKRGRDEGEDGGEEIKGD